MKNLEKTIFEIPEKMSIFYIIKVAFFILFYYVCHHFYKKIAISQTKFKKHLKNRDYRSFEISQKT